MFIVSIESTNQSLSLGMVLNWESKLKLIPYLIAVSSVLDYDEKLEILDAMADIIDEVIEKYKGPLYREALEVIGYPLVDIYELVEALGVDGLESILDYAESILNNNSETLPVEVELYSDLMGWVKDLKSLSPQIIAYSILLSLIASFNKTLNNISRVKIN